MSLKEQGCMLIKHGSAAALEQFLSRNRDTPWDEYLYEAIELDKPLHIRVIAESQCFDRRYQQYLNSAAYVAYMSDQRECMNLLLEYGASNFNEILFAAVGRGDLETAQDMIDRGADEMFDAVILALTDRNYDLAIDIIRYLKE